MIERTGTRNNCRAAELDRPFVCPYFSGMTIRNLLLGRLLLRVTPGLS